MKLKPYVRIRPGKISAGTTLVDDELRADMFLPAWVLTIGMLFTMFGVIMGIVFVILQISLLMVALATMLILLGIGFIVWWKNQTIRMLSNDIFEYRTFFGNKTIYRFVEIREIKQSSGSITLIVGKGKVYIDSCAIVSERLSNRINQQMNGKYCSVRKPVNLI